MKKFLILGLLIVATIIGFNILKDNDKDTFNEKNKDIIKDNDDGSIGEEKEDSENKENKENKEESDDIKDNNKDIGKDSKDETRDDINLNEDNIITSIEDVKLIAKKRVQHAVEGLELLIGDDNLIEVSEEYSLNASLSLVDLNNDSTKDIVIIEHLGGSGDIKNIYAYLRYDNDVTTVLSPDNYISQDSFFSKYLGEGDIYFKDTNTDFEITFNIGKPYEDDGMDLEEVKKRFGFRNKAWVDPYSAYDVKDINNDGTYEILARQIICGIAHVDIIGEMVTVYSNDGDKYIPTEVIYYKYDHETWEKSEIGKSKVKNN